jgi:hypothetical protein
VKCDQPNLDLAILLKPGHDGRTKRWSTPQLKRRRSAASYGIRNQSRLPNP